MTRIPCHGPCNMREWAVESRSIKARSWSVDWTQPFQEATARNSKASSPPEVVFHGQQAGPMEVEQEGVDGGVCQLRDRNRPEMNDRGIRTNGLSRMTLSQLVEEAKKGGAMIPERPTRGAMLQVVRDLVEVPAGHTICQCGRYRGWAFEQIPSEYLDWAVGKVAVSQNHSDDLRAASRGQRPQGRAERSRVCRARVGPR